LFLNDLIPFEGDVFGCVLEVGLRVIMMISSGVDVVDRIDLGKFKESYVIVFAGGEKDHLAAINFMKESLAALLESAVEEPESPEKSLMKHLREDNDPTTDAPYTQEMKESHFFSHILAGYHTSVIGLIWCLYNIACFPEVQEKIINELDKELEENGIENITSDKLRSFVYLNNVIRETFRYSTVAPYATRLVEENMKIGDFNVKKGSAIFTPIKLFHHHPQYWDNPEEFIPERWNDDKEIIQRGCYMPFGYGTRICYGEKLATSTIRLILCEILKKARIELLVPKEEVIGKEGFLFWPVKGLPLKIVPRN